jgi:two-component system, cell cycle sensor histidine kinase and response regulator CckA
MFPFDYSSPLSMSLLFVEDDATARELAVTSLRVTFPFLQLYLAANGEEGLKLYEKHRPDIVVTDVSMPIMDGICMSQQILAGHARANIIVISGHTELCYLLKSIELGIRHYLLKPLQHRPLFDAVSDCVKRVQLEKQVREQEKYIRLLSKVVEQNSCLIAIADIKGKIRYANDRFTEVTGYGREEMLKRDLRQLHFHGASDREFMEVWKIISSGEEWRGEGVNRKENGELYHECASIAPISDDSGRISHFVTIREDISSRKRSQEEMDRAQKLESLGVLAGGIAHDFNNILTGVLGNLSFALPQIPASHRARRPLQEAERAALRAADLTRELLTFSRGGAPVKKVVSIGQLIGQSASFALRGGNIVSEISIPDSIRAVEVDEAQIRQAFQNILINSVQAMPDGGKVTITAENVQLEGDNELGLRGGEYIKVSFSDQGYGIAEGIRGKVFDPYFSTKTGRSGLGLASAHSIISRHGGHIGVDPPPGKGATLICYMPSTDLATAEKQDSRQPLPEERCAGGAVLIMDDDSSVLGVAEKILRCLGYQTTTCSNGVDAIALYVRAKNLGRPYLAVIMDLTVVGGMGGKEAAQHILAHDPRARLVVSSGYSDDPVLADHKRYGFCSVLPKPYRVANVADVMSQVQEDSAV